MALITCVVSPASAAYQKKSSANETYRFTARFPKDHQARPKLTKKKMPLFLYIAPLWQAFKKSSIEMGELHYPLNFAVGGKTTKGEMNGAHTQNNYGEVSACVCGKKKKVVRTKKNTSVTLLSVC
jgi:hypothetical protein